MGMNRRLFILAALLLTGCTYTFVWDDKFMAVHTRLGLDEKVATVHLMRSATTQQADLSGLESNPNAEVAKAATAGAVEAAIHAVKP